MKVRCDTCSGTGEVMYSCCTGEIISDDMDLCPVCFDHMGEGDCEDCEGTGLVGDTKELTPVAPGVQAKAENYADQEKERTGVR